MYRVATGGVKLQVPAEFVADARIILAQDWSWPDDELGPGRWPRDGDDESPCRSRVDSRAFLVEVIVVPGAGDPADRRAGRAISAANELQAHQG